MCVYVYYLRLYYTITIMINSPLVAKKKKRDGHTGRLYIYLYIYRFFLTSHPFPCLFYFSFSPFFTYTYIYIY